MLFFAGFGITSADTIAGPLNPSADGSLESANWKTGATACTTTDCYDEVADSSDATVLNNTASGSESFVVSTGITSGSTITSADVSFRAYYTNSCTLPLLASKITPFVRLNGATTYNGSSQTLTDTVKAYTKTVTVGATLTGNFEIGVTYLDGACDLAIEFLSPLAFGIKTVHAAGEDTIGYVTKVSVSNIVYTPYVPPVPLMTISGTVYQDVGVTPTSSTVKIVVNGTTASSVAAAANGTFVATTTAPTAGTVITVYMDNGAANRSGAVVTRYAGSGNITGLNIYRYYLIVRHEDSGPLTNANIGVCDKNTGSSCTDADLHYAVSGGALTVDNDWSIYAWSGKTYTPGGDVTLSSGGSYGKLFVAGTVSFGANNLTVGGSTGLTVPGTFSQTTGTTTILATGIWGPSGGGSMTLGNVLIGSSTSAFTSIASGTMTVAGVFSMASSSGSMALQGNNVGDGNIIIFTGTGTPFVPNNETITGAFITLKFQGSGATTIMGTGINVSSVIGTIEVGGSGTTATYTAGMNFQVTNLRIATSTGVNTLAGSDKTIKTAIFKVGTNGVFSPGTSTFQHSSGGDTTVVGTTYYNLTVGGQGTSVIYTLGGNMTASGTLTLTGGTTTFDMSSYTATLSGGGTPMVLASGPVFTPGTGTVNYTGISATTIASTTYYNLGIGTTADSNAVTYTLLDNTTVSNLLTLGNSASGATDTLSPGAYTLTLLGSATPVSATSKGVFSGSTGTVKYVGGGSYVAATTYFNLTVSPSSSVQHVLGTGNGQTLTVNGDLQFDFLSNANVQIKSSNYNPAIVVGGNFTLSTCNATCYSSGPPYATGTGVLTFSPTETKTFTNNLNNNVYFGDTSITGGSATPQITYAGTASSTFKSLSVASGHTFSDSTANTITVSGGSVTGAGTITKNSGVFKVSGTGNFGGSVPWTFGTLLFSSSTTGTATGGITVSSTLTIASGATLNAGGQTWTFSGSGTPFVKTGTFTPSTSTVLYAGITASNIAAATYYNLQVGSSTATTVYTLGGDTNVNGVLTINNSSGINGLAASSYTLLFASSGTVFVINENGASSTAFQAGTGTVNFTGAGTTTIPVLTYYHLGVKPSSTNSHQFAAGTIIIGGNFTVGDGTHTGMVDASPNSTTLSVTGNMTISASGVFKANTGNTLSIGGNYTNSGTLVHNSGQFTFNGTSQQTLSGTLNGGSTFSRLVFSNNSGTLTNPSILLATSTQTAATSTIVTASTTVRFTAGQTYMFNSLNWNGQATTSRVGLRSSSPSTAWLLNVAGAKSVQNVDVKDSNACGSSAHISVGNDSLDSGGNTCWDWPLPGTPGIPTFPYVSSTWVVVNWTTSTDTTFYNLYRSPSSGGTYVFITSTTIASSTNTGLTPGTTYWYEVVGENSTGVGPTSTAAIVITLSVSQGYATSASLTSVIFDTAVTGGVAPNSITWQGTRPAGTTVKFQMAGATSTVGPWTYTAWNGSGSNDFAVACDSVSYYPRTGTSEPNTAVELKAICQQNKRYLRYKLFMETSSSSTTPTVADIILNYAR